MHVSLFGSRGKVGQVLRPALERAGHTVHDADPAHCDVAVDFTRPDAVVDNILRCLDAGVPVVVGTTGWNQSVVREAADAASLPVFFAPNFSIGAVLMMRFAAMASRWMPDGHIVERHDVAKRDTPSATALATAAVMSREPPISSIRLPGLIAHQEVVLGAAGQTLTIRHDTMSREAFVPGVLVAINAIRSLPPGVTVGLDVLMP